MCKKVILSLALFVSCWGGISAGVFGYIRELEHVERDNTERARLERKYAEQQRELEIRLEYAERTITGAREIVERTGSQLEQSAGNLREASRVIWEVYYQIKRLGDCLNNWNTSGGESGDSAGVNTNKVTGR